jgi:CheY-like chemotaxis protein/HPt (histidine-containing phosphotransfer) domain-containing protein
VSGGRKKGKRILVVDDNEINRFVATEQLAEFGFDVDVACNGKEAVERAKNGQYVIILMDCQMPILDGYGAARAIREWEGNQRHIPIIALTAHAMAGERDKVLLAGMDDYLSKPLRAQSLERMLERYLAADAQELVEPQLAPVSGGSTSKSELDPNVSRSPKLIQLFIACVPDDLTELDAAINAQSAKTVREKAHKLKGSCLALGADLMADEAESLQLEAEGANLQNAQERARRLWEQYDRVCLLMQ